MMRMSELYVKLNIEMHLFQKNTFFVILDLWMNVR